VNSIKLARNYGTHANHAARRNYLLLVNDCVKSNITMVADTCVAAYLCTAAYRYVVTYLAIMSDVAMLKHPGSRTYRCHFGSTRINSDVAGYYAVVAYYHFAYWRIPKKLMLGWFSYYAVWPDINIITKGYVWPYYGRLMNVIAH
jgi:hypothetical protein